MSIFVEIALGAIPVAPASPHGRSRPGSGRCRVIHLRVVSPPDVTGALMPMLRSEPAVMNLTMLPGMVS
jgi:hypothetical protein